MGCEEIGVKKYKKKELLGIITSLEKINHAVARNFSLHLPVTIEVLAECQESAIKVGDILEAGEGQSKDIVNILSEYCENLYQMSLVINDNVRSRKIAKKIQKQLSEIKSRIKYDLPNDKIEIVFLPYKASMWDSMESVWKAALRDGMCDTYVVPIPYFDKNPNGTWGQMHCEAKEYPPYVQVTDWQEYDIARRRPDVIYIHNPYDEFNYVTSVHPMFYAKELKKYTDMLVYIPYFVAIGNQLQKHFCILPGTIYADRVIVQSETVREIYVGQFRQFVKESGRQDSSGGVEEKFMALGSPKYDKVFPEGEKPYEIPKEWEKLIFRADGSRKKVVLYNITIDTVLKQDEKMLRKIRAVLDSFRAKDGVVLLWRPHPLMVSALESMRPHIAAEYHDIVNRYKKEGFGIFDGSADLHRAIAISDAYFGDMSSVAELYRQTGKSIFIQSFLESTNRGLMFEGYVQVDEFTAYASSTLFNGLFKIDVCTDKCAYVGKFPQERENGKRLHSKAIYVDGKIYFAPASAEYISVYDVLAGEFGTVSIHDYRGENRFYKPALKFADAIKYRNYIFFISATYPAVIRMDCGTRVLDYYADWVTDDSFIFRQGTLVKEPVFYIPNTVGNTVLKFHMDECKGELFSVGSNNHGSWSICEAGSYYWLIPRNKGAFIRWDPVGNIVAEYDDYPENFADVNFLFTKGYSSGGFLRAIPAYANMSVKIDPETGKITENEFAKVGKDEAIGFLFESGPYYYLFRQRKMDGSSVTEYIANYRLNILDNTLEECCFEFCDRRAEFIADYYKGTIGQKTGKVLYREEQFFTLEDFLENVIAEKDSGDNSEDALFREGEMLIGRRIHDGILDLLDK